MRVIRTATKTRNSKKNMSNEIQDVESQFLAGIFKYPDLLFQISNFDSSYFKYDFHRSIFSILKKRIFNNEPIDISILISDLKGVSYTDKEINIADYLESFEYSQISQKGVKEYAKKLIDIHLRRISFKAGKDLQQFAKQDSRDLSGIDIITESNKVYSKNFENIVSMKGPKGLYDDIIDKINEKANNPVEEFGFRTPYPEFNRLYGGFAPGNVYAFVARPKMGKTTFLNYTCDWISKEYDIPVLMLDTEMETEEVQFRTAAFHSGVPLWYILTGNWVKNDEMVKKMKDAFTKMGVPRKVDHHYVANVNVDNILAIIRQWIHQKVGVGNKCLVCYDYIKMTGEKLGNNWAEHQVIGDKVDKFKMIAKELDFPLVTSMQLNRMAEGSHNKAGSEVDSGMVSLSDRLSWFASYIGAFVKKNPDSIQRDGPNFGTHKLVTFFSRYQGREARGFSDGIERADENGNRKMWQNYVNFNVENFKVEERGTLKDIVDVEEGRVNQNNVGRNEEVGETGESEDTEF